MFTCFNQLCHLVQIQRNTVGSNTNTKAYKYSWWQETPVTHFTWFPPTVSAASPQYCVFFQYCVFVKMDLWNCATVASGVIDGISCDQIMRKAAQSRLALPFLVLLHWTFLSSQVIHPSYFCQKKRFFGHKTISWEIWCTFTSNLPSLLGQFPYHWCAQWAMYIPTGSV